MALGRISGAMLQGNLERDGSDLAFETDLLYLDVANNRIGIKNTTPAHNLDVATSGKIGNIVLNGSAISATGQLDFGAPADITLSGGSNGHVLSTDGSGNLSFTSLSNIIGASGTDGMSIVLGTPTDTSLVTEAAWDGWLTTTKVTDAIDNLNQVALNIAKETYVGQADFTESTSAGPSPLTVNFTSAYTGTADTFFWDFGDGNSSTQENPSHTYVNNLGGQFTVEFRASNSSGTFSGVPASGAIGSYDDVTKTNLITLYTPNPIPAFTITDDSIDSGSSAEITNSSQYTTSFDLDWGDGTQENPANGWTTETHVYSNPSGDTQYAIQLDATSTTAGPSPVTVTGTPQNIQVFDTHTPTFTANTVVLANEESAGGGIVTFTNTTATNPGSTSTFNANRYRWTYGDGDIDTINIQGGVAGNPGSTIQHLFSLSSSNQTNGVSETFDVKLEVINEHTTSPFASGLTSIKIEPDVRSNFSGSADRQSDRIGDNAQDIYLHNDYRDNFDRAAVTFTSTAEHADDYLWDFGDGTNSGTINEGDPGTTTGGTLAKTYASSTVGNKTVTLTVNGTPDTLAQSDVDTKTNYIQINSNPPAPASLSSRTLSLSTSGQPHQGFDVRLASGATDNSGGNIPSAGSSVTRYVSGLTNVNTNSVTDVNTDLTGTLTAKVNNVAAGTVTFNITTDQSATFTDLVLTDDRDAHDSVSSSTYPTGFFRAFDANISTSFAGLSTGYSDFQLTHDTGGDTNNVGFLKDDLSSNPTLNINSAVVTQTAPGTLKHISGIPYYNNSSNTISVAGIEVSNWIGQAYRNGSNFFFEDSTNDESTTDSIINTQSKSYSDIDGASTMLSSGTPIAGTGQGSAYALGNITFSINRSARAVAQVQAKIRNVNGDSNTVIFPTKFNVYSSSLTGFDEEDIDVPSTLGGTFSDNGKRVALGLTGDNPSYTAADFFTNNPFTGAITVAGTDEAIVRWGTLKHYDDDNFSTGYLPVGPDLVTGRTGAQYFTFAFRRTNLANFDINITTSTGIAGLWLAAPGTGIDASASSTNGWIDGTASYAGAGLPGTDTSAGGNGDTGCALTSTDRVPVNTAITNTSYTMTLGSENLSNATGKNCLIRVRLDNGQSLSSISIEAAA